MELSEIRKEIDSIDNEVLELFLRRMELSAGVAKYKAEHGLPILNRQREREILEDVTRRSGDMELYSYNLFSTLMQLSRAYQSSLTSADTGVSGLVRAAETSGDLPKTATVACQGVEGANSQVACDKLFPRGRIVYVKSFEAVFDAVGSGLCEYGVLPIENSTNGSVRDVYDLLQKRGFYIVRSTRLNIRHELLAKPGTALTDIREIYSHQQAIGQCRKFLASLDAKVIPMANTAMAAQQVAAGTGNGAAAISSSACAELYGLTTLKSDIQDSDNNYTRFICIAKNPAIYPGANRTSLVLDCSNTPGALNTLIMRIAAQGVNMTKLESCPVTGSNFEYVFFIDLELSPYDPGAVEMLGDLERTSKNFAFLGAYQEV